MPQDRHTLLVIDDDNFVKNTLQKKLGSFGTDVLVASGVLETSEVLKKYLPEVIVLDWKLKDGIGQQVLDILREDARLENIPVLIVTNVDDEQIKSSVLKQGVKEYLIKGSTGLDVITAKVKSYFKANHG